MAIAREIGDHDSEGSALGYLGYALYEQKKYEEALTLFQRGIEIMPHNVQLWNGMGFVLDSLKRFDEAVEAYTRAIELSPDSALLYRNRASVFIKQNYLAEAAQDTAKAIALEPDNPYTHARQGYLAIAQGQFVDALPHLQFAATHDKSKSWQFGLALSKFALGKIEEAKAEISRALPDAKDEEREEARNWLARIVELKPDLEKDAQIIRDILA